MDYDDFHSQFLLQPAGEPPFPDWPSRECGPWRLSSHPQLPVARILLPDGDHAGFVMGHVIRRDASFLQGDIEWNLPRDPEVANREIRRHLLNWDGRFAVIVLRPDLGHVYLDAAGTLPLVFCRRRRRLASTPGLIVFDEQPNRIFSISPDAFPADRADHFFPAGLTCDPEIRRLLPNHHLELDDWAARRHFPDGPITWASDDQIAESVRSIYRAIRRQFAALARAHEKIYISLTAGRDSRVLLACAREFIDQVECVTFHGDPTLDAKRLDREIPARLAARLGFRHAVLETRGTLPPDVTIAYQRRTGFVVNPAKARNFDLACRRDLDMSAAWISGHGGEVGRAVYFARKLPPTEPIAAEILLTRLALGRRKEFVAPLSNWLKTLPPDHATHHLTLAYIEHRLGAWASPHLYGGAPFRTKLLPFCSHEVFQNMLRLPPEYQRGNALTRDIIRIAWPDLLSEPFNADRKGNTA